MSEGKRVTPPKKNIVGLRTFADDVERVRAAQEGNRPLAQKTVALPSKLNQQKKEVPKNTQPVTAPTPTKSKEEHSNNAGAKSPSSNEGVVFETDPEIPPFHSIRASRPEDTTFGTAEEIPDKKSLQKSTIATKAPPPKLTTTTESLDIDDEVKSLSKNEGAPSLDGESSILDVTSSEQELGEATIVTDQKRKRFRLLPAIVKSLTGWFHDTKKDINRAHTKRRANQKVRKSSQRKEIIKKAAERTRRVPHDDFESVRERLKKVQRNTDATTEFNIKKKEVVEPQIWKTENVTDSAITKESDEILAQTYTYDTPQTETASASIEQLEAMLRGNVSDLHKPVPEDSMDIQQTQTAPSPQIGYSAQIPDTHTADTDIPPQSPKLENEIPSHEAPPAETDTATYEDLYESLQSTVDEVIEQPREENAADTLGGYREYRERYGEDYKPQEEVFLEELPPQTTQTIPEDTLRMSTPPIPAERIAWASQKQKTRSVQKQIQTGTPYLTLIAVIIAAVILGAGTSIWWFTKDDGNRESVTTPVAAIQNTIPLSADRATFIATLKNTVDMQGTDTTYIVPVIGNTPAVATDILDTLSLSADGSFLRNITDITFGSHNNAPFIVIHISSFDTAFGGILLWESSMNRDLAPLFSPAVQTAGKDVRISNADTRILTDEVGREVLVYGFVNKQTILIAPTRDVFIEVFSSLR